MFTYFCLFGLMAITLAMVITKKMTTIIKYFICQSFFLFLIEIYAGIKMHQLELYIIALLILIVKVISVPIFLNRIIKKTNINLDIEFIINPVFSFFFTLILMFLSYIFVSKYFFIEEQRLNLIVSFSIILIGMFLMIVRTKALTQVIGLLVIENGIFLVSTSIVKHLPFLIEIAIFFDIFFCVVILEFFIYKINKIFTHTDVHKLTNLKG